MWREYYTNEDPLTFKIVEWSENSTLVSEIADKNLPFGGKWTYKMESQGAQTLLAITENGEVCNPIFRFISTLIMGHEGTINQYMAGLETAFNQ